MRTWNAQFLSEPEEINLLPSIKIFQLNGLFAFQAEMHERALGEVHKKRINEAHKSCYLHKHFCDWIEAAKCKREPEPQQSQFVSLFICFSANLWFAFTINFICSMCVHIGSFQCCRLHLTKLFLFKMPIKWLLFAFNRSTLSSQEKWAFPRRHFTLRNVPTGAPSQRRPSVSQADRFNGAFRDFSLFSFDWTTRFVNYDNLLAVT